MGRRMVGLHAVFLASALMLGGCGTRNKVVNFEIPNENVTTITFFGNKYEPENVTVIEEILSDFMKENPGIRVSYESLKGNEYYEALGKRFDAGKGDDVFMVNHDVLMEMQSRGQLVDLSGLKTTVCSGRWLSMERFTGFPPLCQVLGFTVIRSC